MLSPSQIHTTTNSAAKHSGITTTYFNATRPQPGVCSLAAIQTHVATNNPPRMIAPHMRQPYNAFSGVCWHG